VRGPQLATGVRTPVLPPQPFPYNKWARASSTPEPEQPVELLTTGDAWRRGYARVDRL